MHPSAFVQGLNKKGLKTKNTIIALLVVKNPTDTFKIKDQTKPNDQLRICWIEVHFQSSITVFRYLCWIAFLSYFIFLYSSINICFMRLCYCVTYVEKEGKYDWKTGIWILVLLNSQLLHFKPRPVYLVYLCCYSIITDDATNGRNYTWKPLWSASTIVSHQAAITQHICFPFLKMQTCHVTVFMVAAWLIWCQIKNISSSIWTWHKTVVMSCFCCLCSCFSHVNQIIRWNLKSMWIIPHDVCQVISWLGMLSGRVVESTSRVGIYLKRSKNILKNVSFISWLDGFAFQNTAVHFRAILDCEPKKYASVLCLPIPSSFVSTHHQGGKPV